MTDIASLGVEVTTNGAVEGERDIAKLAQTSDKAALSAEKLKAATARTSGELSLAAKRASEAATAEVRHATALTQKTAVEDRAARVAATRGSAEVTLARRRASAANAEVAEKQKIAQAAARTAGAEAAASARVAAARATEQLAADRVAASNERLNQTRDRSSITASRASRSEQLVARGLKQNEREATLASLAEARLERQRIQNQAANMRLAASEERLAEQRARSNLQANNENNPAGAANHNVANIAAQFQDIGVTAAMGMSPIQIALQQGTQLSAVLTSMQNPIRGLAAAFMSVISPVSLITIGVIAASVALFQWWSNRTKVDQMDATFKRHAATVESLGTLYGHTAEELAALGTVAGGNLFARISVDLNQESLEKGLKRARESIAAFLSGRQGWMSDAKKLELGYLASPDSLTGVIDELKSTDFGPFQGALDELLAAISRGEDGFDTFQESIQRVREAAGADARIVAPLQMQLLALTTQLADVGGGMEAFRGPILQFQLGLQDGTASVERLLEEVYRINAESGFQFNDALKPIHELAGGFLELERRAKAAADSTTAAARATESVLANAASSAARTDADRIDTAARVARADNAAKDPEAIAEAVRLAVLKEQLTIENEISRGLFDRSRQRVRSLEDTKLEITLLGETVGEATRLREQFNLIAELREEAELAGRLVNEEEVAAAEKLAASMGRAAEFRARYALYEAQSARFRDVTAEAATLGMNEASRARALAAAEAENELRQENVSLTDDAARAYIRQNVELAEYEMRVRRIAGAYGELRNAGEQAIDGFVDGLLSGDITGAITSALDEAQKAILELGFTNPLKNWLLGTNHSTLQDLMGGLGAGPNAPVKPTRETVGLTEATAMWVRVANTGLYGTAPLGEVERRALPDLEPTDPASARVASAFEVTADPGARQVMYRNAIAAIESRGSGDYSAVGPTHPKYGRALGRYQVMESNIPQWSQAALGRTISAQEFMANPALQDRIFDHRFGGYVSKHGERNAAQAWFGGEGSIGKTGRRDVLGTSVGGYGDRFIAELARLPQTGQQAATTAQTFTTGLGDTLNNTIVGGVGAVADQFVPGLGGVLQGLLSQMAEAGKGGSSLGSISRGLLGGVARPSSAVAAAISAGAGGLFSEGGYTGDLPADRVAGIVHGGEYVFSKRATDAIGIGQLSALHDKARGYARGGYVGAVPPAASKAPQAGGGVSLSVVNNGEPMDARVERRDDGNGNVSFDLVLDRKMSENLGRRGSRSNQTVRRQLGGQSPVISR